ncbi:hypothetical protein ACS0TY_029659 [Phlomoides rotata]
MSNGLQSFHNFFECWIVKQNHHLQELVAAADGQPPPDDKTLRPLLQRVIQHYEHYYRAKSRWAKNDVVSMFNPSWLSSLEDAFLWIGGWRPTMAFHLLYSMSGLQLEARLDELLRGISTGDLGDLGSGQLEYLDRLQRETVMEEKEVTEELARQQETVADTSMVELVTEMMREGAAEEEDGGRVAATLAPKEEGMVVVLQRADDLRLRTLKAVIEVLTPMQAVHFLLAAAALHLRVHEWGKKRDVRLHQTPPTGADR